MDALITGVGTGGHITGCAEVLKPRWPALKVFAVEPALSPVISGGAPAPHPIQGIGAGFVPANLHTALLDGVMQVEAEEAREYARRSAREEGLLVGISSGATLAAIAQQAAGADAGRVVLGFNYDTGERYLSVPDFLPGLSTPGARRPRLVGPVPRGGRSDFGHAPRDRAEGRLVATSPACGSDHLLRGRDPGRPRPRRRAACPDGGAAALARRGARACLAPRPSGPERRRHRRVSASRRPAGWAVGRVRAQVPPSGRRRGRTRTPDTAGR